MLRLGPFRLLLYAHYDYGDDYDYYDEYDGDYYCSYYINGDAAAATATMYRHCSRYVFTGRILVCMAC